MIPRPSLVNRSLSAFLFLALLLVGASCYFLPTRSLGIEPDSSLFDSASSSATLNGSKGLPLDLPSEIPSASPSLLDTLARVLVALTLVIVLIVATIWGLKLIWEKRGLNHPGDDGKSFRVLSSVFIAPRKTIQLIEIGKRIIVVGVGNEEIHPLDVIDDPDEVEELKKSSKQGFPVLLEKILHRTDSQPTTVDAEEMIADSKKTLDSYIERLKGASKKKQKGSGEKDGEKD